MSLLITLALTATGYPTPQIHLSTSKLTPKLETAIAHKLGKILRENGAARLVLRDGIQVASAKKILSRNGIAFVLDNGSERQEAYRADELERDIARQRAIAKLYGKEGEEAGVDFFEALEFYLQSRVDANGELPRDIYQEAVRHREGMPAASMTRKGTSRGSQGRPAVGATWSFQGSLGLDVPYRQYYGVATISGRKNDVQYAPSNPAIMYAASAGGGIWKSTDSGVTWTPKSDGWKFLHSTTIAVSPTDPNLVIAGTGDYHGFFSAQTFGVMRSTDGGTTWSNVGVAQMGDKIISKIVFDPNDPNIVLATAGRGSTMGDIYRSTDGGLTWSNTNAADGSWDDIDFAGVEIAPGVRRVWAGGGGSGGGTRIAYSDDHGATWTAVAKPALFNAVEQTINVAGSRNDPDGIYVIGPVGQKVYKSSNGGATWVDITTGLGADWSQSTYDVHITCGNNAGTDTIFVGLISVHASANGGTTWADIGLTAQTTSKWHNDQHCMTMHPTTQNAAFVGGDGGLAQVVYTPASNSATFTMRNSSFGDTQFYSMALHPTNFNYVMGGTQDNATPASRGNLSAWDNLYAGDGGFCGFNKAAPGTHYTTSQGGNIYRYDSDLDATPTSITPSGTSVFVTPLAMGNTTYNNPFTVKGSKVKRYTGTNWSNSTTTLNSNADRITVSPRNGQRLYTCHANGSLYMSTNNGGTLTLKDGNLPNLAIGDIAESKLTDYDCVAVLKTTDATAGRVFRCTNINVASPVWTDISGSGVTGLPKIPCNAVTRDPFDNNVIYVGTDIGCFMTTDGGATWSNMNTLGLPNVHVNDLIISNGNGFLYAATFGRGIWRIAITP